MAKDGIDYEKLWLVLTQQFYLGTESVHGPSHWRRVEEIGLRLSADSGADVTVVRLFAVFHDCRRMNESWDPQHGPRAAILATEMAGKHFQLDAKRLDLLVLACRQHTDGKLSSDPTVGTCWDSDRLDLPRVGVIPRPKMLSTKIARQPETIAWALAMKRR
jgi:uncharacterized protein